MSNVREPGYDRAATPAALGDSIREASVSLDKKQKKQLELLRKKLGTAKQQLAGAKKQLDDPREVARLEAEVRALEEQIGKIQGQ